jgi:hypothetical protein
MKPSILCSVLFAALIQTTPGAAEEPQMTELQLRENWGRVMYCERIYRHTNNQRRVYEFDVKQCEKANELMQQQANLYGENKALALKDIANQRAIEIEYSTVDVTAVINACRESCRKLSVGPDTTINGK